MIVPLVLRLCRLTPCHATASRSHDRLASTVFRSNTTLTYQSSPTVLYLLILKNDVRFGSGVECSGCITALLECLVADSQSDKTLENHHRLGLSSIRKLVIMTVVLVYSGSPEAGVLGVAPHPLAIDGIVTEGLRQVYGISVAILK